MGFMAHEIAMKYLVLGFTSHEKLVYYIDSIGHENYTQRFQGS